jgi:hypothetical protein
MVGNTSSDSGPGRGNRPLLSDASSKASFIIIILILLAVLPAASYAGAAEDFQAALNASNLYWITNIAIACLIGFIMAGLGYMLSNALQSRELGIWAKSEVAEMTGTVFLIAIILLAIGFSDALFRAVDWNGDKVADEMTPMQASASFASDATTALLNAYYRGMQINLVLSLLTGPPRTTFGANDAGSDKTTGNDDISKSLKASLPGIPIPIMFMTLYVGAINYYPFSGISVFMMSVYSFQSLVLMAAAMSSLLGAAAEFIAMFTLPVLLPLGILLRAFTFTRKMGSTIIAIAVCLYFFFPAAMLICDQMYKASPKYDPPELQNPKILNIELHDPSSMMAPFFGPGAYFAKCNTGDWWYFVCLIEKLLNWVGDLLNALIEFGGFIINAVAPGAILPSLPAFFISQENVNIVMGDVVAILANYIPHAMSYAVPIILSPVIILIICITAMRSISPAIGGEIQILGVSELI